MIGSSPRSEYPRTTVAVMQPYLFPYFPYVQLLACVDKFIVFDTAQYISRGWSNRNSLLVDGELRRFTIPIQRHPRSAPYSDIVFADNLDRELAKLRNTVAHASRNLRHGAAALRLIDDTFPLAMDSKRRFVDAFELMASSLLRMVGAKTQLVRASTVSARGDESAQDYVIRLIQAVGGSTYVNPIGGISLYDERKFVEHGLGLCFLRTELESPVPNLPAGGLLSLLDDVARYSPIELRTRLGLHRLVSAACVRPFRQA